VQRLLGVVCIACLAVACSSGPSANVSPSVTPTSQSLLVVYATWVPDGTAVAGPEPGYKPALMGLTSHDIQRASAAIDPNGTFWVVNVTFTSRGAALFKQLTRDNVAACPTSGGGTSPSSVHCAERYLGIWLDLTQRDIDNWDDPAYAAKVSQPFDLDCLRHTAATCPKLLTNAITLQEIDGGSAEIISNFTEQTANELANAINSASHA
jgi:preprotein translocase subunit SecD